MVIDGNVVKFGQYVPNTHSNFLPSYVVPVLYASLTAPFPYATPDSNTNPLSPMTQLTVAVVLFAINLVSECFQRCKYIL